MLRVLRAILLAIIAALFAGCSDFPYTLAPSGPAAPGYVTSDSGGYTLRIVDACRSVSMNQVVVKRIEPDKEGFDELDTIWSAHSPTGATRSVVLFADNPGFVIDVQSDPVDLGVEVVVWWADNTGYGGAVSGVLSELGPTTVLWAKGLEDRAGFEKNQSHYVFGCND